MTTYYPENTSWVSEYTASHTTASVEWRHYGDGSVDLRFRVTAAGAEETRHYKTAAAAKGAETRFYNRLYQIFN